MLLSTGWSNIAGKRHREPWCKPIIRGHCRHTQEMPSSDPAMAIASTVRNVDSRRKRGGNVTSKGPNGGEEDHRLTDATAIKALAHPMRLAIVEHLGSTRTAATATELAQVVGLSVSATSWHLRSLAKVGVIAQAEGRGDGRERLWRMVGSGLVIERDVSGDPERGDAESAYIAVVLARSDERLKDWLAHDGDAPARWRDALRISDSQLLLTREELNDLNAAYDELMRPYLRRDRRQAPPGARRLSSHLRLVPHAEDLP